MRLLALNKLRRLFGIIESSWSKEVSRVKFREVLYIRSNEIWTMNKQYV